METLFRYSTEQYDFVRESRKVLLDFSQTMSSSDFKRENSSFGNGGSIRNLFMHIANTYEFWVAKCGLNKIIDFTKSDSEEGIQDIRSLFDTIDRTMYEFIESFKNNEIKEIDFEINGLRNSASPFKIFSHVITHEFHHKGQILSLSRQLGYVPVDTDIMR
jgi:uncharacterized damage-inducible protein DinB